MDQAAQATASVESRLLDSWPMIRWRGVRIAVGVSGGPDSVALLRALHRLIQSSDQPPEASLEVLHFNHQWREQASHEDENFVTSLCKVLALRCTVGRAPPSVLTVDCSEDSARQQRYSFFQRTAETLAARYVVTAHTRDDQVETVMHRIVRGTGLRGLAGIRQTRRLSQAVTVVRPLLSHSRAELLAYLAELKQPFQTDQSNENTRFTRNRIRHELLPTLAREYNPQVADALLKLGDFAAEANEFIDQLVEQHMESCLRNCDSGQIVLDLPALRQHASFLQRELLASAWRDQAWPERTMGAKQWRRLIKLIRSEDAKLELPGGVEARCDGNLLTLIYRPDK
jgi:tRNA(Ile)-lysidine synthase